MSSPRTSPSPRLPRLVGGAFSDRRPPPRAARRHRIQVSGGDQEALRWTEKGTEMLNLIFNAFGITLTAAAVYGAMDAEIVSPIGFAFAAISVALFANFVEARSI